MTTFSSLPTPRLPLIGRDDLLGAACRALIAERAPLLTLTGPGGIGKTRLALEIAAREHAAFPDGVLFVPLAAVHDPALVLPTIARAAGLRESSLRDAGHALAAAFHDRRALLVLDNLEQVLPAAPDLGALLEACPGVQILATSRTRLQLQAEHVLPVPPLPTPNGQLAVPPSALDTNPAAALFQQRARQVLPGFALTAENGPVVAAIVQRLDGIPLAIELAATRLVAMSLPTLLSELDQRLRPLTGGARDLPPRLRSMTDAIAWSYDLLPVPEQRLFRHLGVFVGGFDIEAAAAVTNRPAALLGDDLRSLVDQSLLQPLPMVETGRERNAPDRFGMLETIREFALDRLAANDELDHAHQAHAAWFLAWAETARPRLEQPNSGLWLDRVETEHANLRAALSWLAERGDHAAVTRLVLACVSFWFQHAHISEGRDWTGRALAMTSEKTRERAALLVARADFVHALGDLDAAETLGREGLAIAQAVADRPIQAAALHVLALTEEFHFRWERATRLYEEELAIRRELGEHDRAGWTLALMAGDAFGQGDLDRAEGLLAEALVESRQTDSHRWLPSVMWYVGQVALARGHMREAALAYRESFTLFAAISDRWWLAKPLAGLAVVAATIGLCELGARLIGAAAAWWERSGVPILPFDQTNFDRVEAIGQARLGATDYLAAIATGRAMSFQEMVATVDAVVAAVAKHQGHGGEISLLSPREFEVLQLLGLGHSDKEIADRLYISRRTASHHVAAILRKLGARSRDDAVRQARRIGLL